MSVRRLVSAVIATVVVGTALSSAPAQAKRHLGIAPEAAPPPPAAGYPTMSLNDRRRAVAEGDLPEFLLPVTYRRGGLHFATRWYDERGQLYRSREVAMVLRAAEDPNVDHHIAWRQRFVAVGAIPLFFGTPLLLAGDQLALGVETYNYRQAAAVRSTTRTDDGAAMTDPSTGAHTPRP